MIFETGDIQIRINETNGDTEAIVCKSDAYQTNYVLQGLQWGHLKGFVPEEIRLSEDSATVCYRRSRGGLSDAPGELLASVKKYAENGRYYESYTVTNQGDVDYFFTHDNFHIRFPFNANFRDAADVYNDRCNNHIWCGGECMWMKTQKPSGNGKKLWMTLEQGEIDDYSIEYPSTLPVSNFRGVFLLHCPDYILGPGESVKLTFAFQFSDSDIPLNALRMEADRYTVYQGESIRLEVTSASEIHSAELYFEDGRAIPFELHGKQLRANVTLDSLGEKKLFTKVNGRKTFAAVNVIRPISEILMTRARFIAGKQQMNKEGSHLEGAYLIYDRTADRQYYEADFCDSNAGRERFAMGIVMACALQEQFDEKLFASLKKHRAFIERELFDVESAKVYNDVCRKDIWVRLYDYAWLSTYYMEWYKLTGELQCLINSANILLRYYGVYDGKKYEPVCFETYEILSLLEKAGQPALYQKLKEAFISHADDIIARNGVAISDEVICANGMVSAMVEILSQVYLLTNENRYLDAAKRVFRCADTFTADQPHYQLNSMALRFWDGFWFGKMKAYGDTFPQWLSSLSGLMYYWYQRASGEDLQKKIQNNLTGAMCLYAEDGFASSCYLFPYKVYVEENPLVWKKEYYKPGEFSGKRYDDWANDQDWALYYAWKILNHRYSV